MQKTKVKGKGGKVKSLEAKKAYRWLCSKKKGPNEVRIISHGDLRGFVYCWDLKDGAYFDDGDPLDSEVGIFEELPTGWVCGVYKWSGWL